MPVKQDAREVIPVDAREVIPEDAREVSSDAREASTDPKPGSRLARLIAHHRQNGRHEQADQLLREFRAGTIIA
jgi:hypothetical protein